jgi:ethanolamine ammonia-lyase small subunit
MNKPPANTDAADRLRSLTQARIALGRVGQAVPTSAQLDFELAHARARDAVQAAFEPGRIASQLPDHDLVTVSSRAPDHAIYLQRPDLGRKLAETDTLKLTPASIDALFVIGDGLSATAVHAHAAPLLRVLFERLPGWRIGPLIAARHARVALGDEIGKALGAPLVVVLIGERPGLSSPDSLGAYLTWDPRPGRLDSERNCVSNIRPPHGLGYDQAAETIVWLMTHARARGLSGIGLKLGDAAIERDG